MELKMPTINLQSQESLNGIILIKQLYLRSARSMCRAGEQGIQPLCFWADLDSRKSVPHRNYSRLDDENLTVESILLELFFYNLPV